MGNNNSLTNIEQNDKNILDEIFQIIKGDTIYTIKTALEKNNNSQNIKITISFVLNNIFQIYEVNLDECPEIDKIENYNQTYQKLKRIIKDEKFEIVHEKNNNEYILLKINIDEKIINIKVFPSKTNNENKLNELTQNYISLEKDYIQLKSKSENKNILNNHSMDIENDNEDEDGTVTPDEDSSNDSMNDNINNNTNNITPYNNIDENHISFGFYSSVWAMLKLNKIIYKENNENKELNLAAISFSNGKIIIININTMKIHQELIAPNTPYSLTQFKDDPNYLISSISIGQLIIYILKDNKYEQFQVLEKPINLKKGEFNKVIALSDGNLLASDRGSLSIWKPKIEEGTKKFEFFTEIITDEDTCHLVEVNPQVFACAIHPLKMIKVFRNDGNEYPLLGKIKNVESHGSNSNGMTRINDNLFCSGGRYGFIYIVSIEPVQLIQKIYNNYNNYRVRFLHRSYDGFIFTSFGEDIVQYKVIYNEDGNFIKLEIYNIINDIGDEKEAIFTTDDGKIFYCHKNTNQHGRESFFLTEYKK